MSSEGTLEETIAVQQAQLSDMPFDVIEGWLMARGFVVVGRDWHRMAVKVMTLLEEREHLIARSFD